MTIIVVAGGDPLSGTRVYSELAGCVGSLPGGPVCFHETPTESEWECASRAGSEREFAFGDDEKLLARYAWYDENSEGRAQEVGTRRENAWGLQDLHGNVWEWCEDTYHPNYVGAPADGTAWTEGGEEWQKGTPGRVMRGGCWLIPAVLCRSAFRPGCLPALRERNLGFRPAYWPLKD